MAFTTADSSVSRSSHGSPAFPTISGCRIRNTLARCSPTWVFGLCSPASKRLRLHSSRRWPPVMLCSSAPRVAAQRPTDARSCAAAALSQAASYRALARATQAALLAWRH
eukprot:Amastigsp_a849218_40.p2 type:complete len:110 gc:universal Amastigsp_a849218_40:378-49(-)